MSFLKVITPEHFPFILSIQFLAMVIIGGMGSILGSIFGAVFMTIVPELLSFVTGVIKMQAPGYEQFFIPLKEVVFGGLIIIFLIFEPHGLAEIWNRLKNFFRLWPFSY
jgi:branched-chain amino acid transport system permease protein